MTKEYILCWIAFKILLKKDDKVLFLRSFGNGFFDLPGGRADDDEGEKPLFKILEREVKEELGGKIKYRLGEPLFQYRRYYVKKNIYNLITVYGADFVSGSIKLSSEHASYEWINPKTGKFLEKDFHNKEEFSAFKKYFRI